MMKRIKTLFVALVMVSAGSQVSARENMGAGVSGHKVIEQMSVMAACTPAVAQIELAVNNVRTRLLTGGDMWWDLISAKYEVPKGGGAHSLFSGSLWIGGIDAGSQLKVAAQTYRQNGNDFWPGPMDTSNVSTEKTVCDQYDKFFKVTYHDVDSFNTWWTTGVPSNYTIQKSLLDWPGNGDQSKFQSHYLAPFFDRNGDGTYDPNDGDFPDYDIKNATGTHRRISIGQGCAAGLYGDETIWNVFNDKGSIHTETSGTAIGLEVRQQSFAYKTNDELNNMTFYNYEIINWSSFTLNDAYFGVWVDADLGSYLDDYVGCDVGRGLGYCYNGQAVDGSGATGTYGANPPAIGVDFFQGPKVGDPVNDGKDSYGTSFVDVNGRIGMAKFVYYNNDFTVRGNPTKAQDYYNYLSGFWIDGLPFTYGGDAYQESGPVCDFMFPGDTDPTGLGTGMVPQSSWSETVTPADRRFMQSAGPFTLDAGAVNTVTFGVVWARATQGGPLASVQALKVADAKAQALFDNCFKITNGPDAPDITLQELKNELVLYITNKATSNNYKEAYNEKDPYISIGSDTSYAFEGYKIYQIIDSTVSVSDLYNPDKARLVFQCDVKNNVKQIVNYSFDNSLSAWIPREEVYGEDKGIVHSLSIKADQFATGDNQLINHKSYYFMATAYGYNKGEVSSNPYNATQGLNVPYLQGRRNVKVYTGIPHIPSPEAYGTIQNADYGTGVNLTRVEGWGNGGNVLDITDASAAKIVSSSTGRIIDVEYEKNRGPVQIKVIDPLNVKKGDYVFKLNDTTRTSANSYWTLTNITTGQTVTSDNTLKIEFEQVIPDWGISVTVRPTLDPAVGGSVNNGFLEATQTYTDNTKLWLSGLADGEGTAAPDASQNWIRAGKNTTGAPDYTGVDDEQIYEKVLGGTWSPYRLCAYSDVANSIYGGPAWSSFITTNKMTDVLNSVDLVITSDKSKWTRCVVLEMCDDPVLSDSNTVKHDRRRAASVDKNGNTGDGIVTSDPEDADFIAARGMGWFPGYAINVETGERLNMAFGENSFLTSENGKDMKWNPTSNTWDQFLGTPIFGGMHYIYIFAHVGDAKFSSGDTYLPNGLRDVPRYDHGQTIWNLLNAKLKQGSATSIYKREVFTDAMWVNIPMLSYGHELFETDVKIRLRVGRHYRKFYSAKSSTADSVIPGPAQNKNFPMYTFNTNDLETNIQDVETAKNALDLINIVPNPYYAYSGYEKNQLDTRVKITNLPVKCTIRIYTLNGTLIRTYNRDDPSKTSIDWDLKNQAGIPIASGMYILHIDAPGIGEKILKWFGALRPIDLDAY